MSHAGGADTPGAAALDALPADARDFVQAELDAGNTLTAVLPPPRGVVASTMVLLGRPCRAEPVAPGARHWPFGTLAPGLPAVVVLGPEVIVHDPPPAPAPRPVPIRPRSRDIATGSATDAEPLSLVRRFARSRQLDHEAWREGESYDLAAIDAASPAERETMLDQLLEDGLSDWRDIEAVQRIGGRAARRALRALWRTGEPADRMALLRHAPDTATERQKVVALVEALAVVEAFGGLSECLEAVEACHPPEVMQALWQAAARADGTAVHCAAMLAWLHGLASGPFDWAQRPFFLRFVADDPADRAAALAELRRRCGASG